MSDRSAIEWTDATWNPVRGCTKVSPGCKFCYAELFAERFRGVPGHPFEQGFDLRLVPEKIDQPLHWRRPRKIFVNSMSDLSGRDFGWIYERQDQISFLDGHVRVFAQPTHAERGRVPWCRRTSLARLRACWRPAGL
jgi:hypothetical protein